jgi:hypothetical protein
MGAYNLYLLDETRDPKVIARLARITGLSEPLVRRELRHPPFLVLREHGLSQAVAVRRDFEQMGLTLRLELVEEPSGDRTHPLAGQQAPADGGEIVLEEGAGFTRSGAAPAGPPAGRARRAWQPRLRRRSLLWVMAALVVAALLQWSLRPASPRPAGLEPPPDLAREMPLLQEGLAAALAAGNIDKALLDSLIQCVGELEGRVRPVWESLSRREREMVEDLLAQRQTLVLRRAASREPPAVVWSARDLREVEAGGPGREEFWHRVAVQWGRREAPASLGEQMALERLEAELERIAAGRADPEARARLAGLERQDPAGRQRLGALRLAGSLRQKGIVWTGEGAAALGWADLPDSTVLEVRGDQGALQTAQVVDGRLVFDPAGEVLTGVSVRLAALERQPRGLRRLLEAGLLLLEPGLFFGTIPGGSLPRLDPALAAAQWEKSGDPALKEELRRLGLQGDDLRRPVLALDSGEGVAEPDLADWLRAAAARYRQARTWPQRLELRTPTGRYRVTGCELWHLTRQGTEE